MAGQIAQERFTKELFDLLEETFDRSHGIYLDRKTSLFETLDTVTAEEASRPVGAEGTTIAAHTEHTRFYLDVLERYMKGEEVDGIDWEDSWQVRAVTAEEWEALRDRLKAAHGSVMALIRGVENWDQGNALETALAIVAHTAYHIGAIRLAMSVVRAPANVP